MGAKPVLATIAFGVARRRYRRLDRSTAIAALRRWPNATGLRIAGGDVVRAPAITISITVVGEVRPSNLKTRSGMRPAIIAITGPLGASRAGLGVAVEAPRTPAMRRRAVLAAYPYAATAPGGRPLAGRQRARASDDGFLRRAVDRSGAFGPRVERGRVDRGDSRLADARAVAQRLGADPMRGPSTAARTSSCSSPSRPARFRIWPAGFTRASAARCCASALRPPRAAFARPTAVR